MPDSPRNPKLHGESVVKPGGKILIPRPPTVEQMLADATASHEKWHTLEEDMAFKRVAEVLGIEPRELLRLNQKVPELKG